MNDQINEAANTDENIYERRSRLTLQLFWFSYISLIAILVITSFPPFLPEGASPLVIIAVKLIPLLIVIIGLLKKKLRSYAWQCFIVLFYFSQGVVEVFLSKGSILDVGIVFFSVTLFLSAMFYIKWQKNLGYNL